MATAQILFRVDLDTKAQIATAAKTQGVSINQWLLGAVAEALAAPPPVAPEPQTLASILARLDALETLVAELTRPTAITDSTPTIIPSPPDPVAPPDPTPMDAVAKILKPWISNRGGHSIPSTLDKLATLSPGMDRGSVEELIRAYKKSKSESDLAAIVNALTTP